MEKPVEFIITSKNGMTRVHAKRDKVHYNLVGDEIVVQNEEDSPDAKKGSLLEIPDFLWDQLVGRFGHVVSADLEPAELRAFEESDDSKELKAVLKETINNQTIFITKLLELCQNPKNQP